MIRASGLISFNSSKIVLTPPDHHCGQGYLPSHRLSHHTRVQMRSPLFISSIEKFLRFLHAARMLLLRYIPHPHSKITAGFQHFQLLAGISSSGCLLLCFTHICFLSCIFSWNIFLSFFCFSHSAPRRPKRNDGCFQQLIVFQFV